LLAAEYWYSLRHSAPFIVSAVFCSANANDVVLCENQFIYSANQLFALGIATPRWGIFNVDALGRVQSTSWQPAGNISGGYKIRLQSDGNVVL
jgi:hypothetical protein